MKDPPDPLSICLHMSPIWARLYVTGVTKWRFLIPPQQSRQSPYIDLADID
jgi:hypothetical protein